MTVTKTCTCKHDYQDIIYGKQQRIFNLSEDGKKASCTVCNNLIPIGSSPKKQNKNNI